MDEDRPAWDEELAGALKGAVVLVGITYEEPDGQRFDQFFGVVESADETGVRLRLGGSRKGGTYNLPPDPGAFHPAAPGVYRLRATGEEVENPDFTSTWTITPPRPE